MTSYDSFDSRTRDWMTERWWQEDEQLRAARDAFAQTGPLIEVPAESGAFLAAMVRATGARRIVEVGTLFGYSATWMARALPEDGHLDTLELEDVHADAAQALFVAAGIDHLVTIHRGAAADSLAHLEGPYDLAFIDADKAGYIGYVEALLDRMRPGGTIIADNLAQAGAVADPSASGDNVVAMRAFHEHLQGHPRLDSTVLPIGDGVSISVVRGT